MVVTKKHVVLALVLAPLLALVCLEVGLAVYEQRPIFWPRTPFDKAAWAQTREGDRYVFVKDLVDSEKLNKFTREEVYGLLGKPSFDNGQDEMSYVVKVLKLPYILDIRFSVENGRKVVSKAFIRLI